MEKIKDLTWTDHGDLLPEDRPLLEGDFAALAVSTATDKEFWVASMETAVAAAGGHVRLKRRCDRLEVARRSVNAVNGEPSVDTEGSMRFWRRRKKNRARYNSSQDLILHSWKEGNHPMALAIALFNRKTLSAKYHQNLPRSYSY